MAAIKTVAILTHLRQGLDPNYYLARCKSQFWEKEGRRVVVHQGTGEPPPADLAFLHVDLTHVPKSYAALAERYPYCVNGAVTDISKRRISRWLVSEADAYDGPVIVKSDLNHGGLSEHRLRAAEARGWLRLRDAAWRWLPRLWGGGAGKDYQIFERKSQVPAWVWRRQNLVVERFFVERHGEHYALHQWFFLGERSYATTLLAASPMVKWASRIALPATHHRVPEALWSRRRELQFDFGKFDYTLQEGAPVLLDANPTPHYSLTETDARSLWFIGVLAAGLDTLSARTKS